MTVKHFFIEKLAPTLEYLSQRWLDEAEYEEWDEYVARVKQIFQPHKEFVFQDLQKKYFRLTFAGDGKTWMVKCMSTRLTLQEVKNNEGKDSPKHFGQTAG